jgi:DNA topoisomerase-1
VIVESPAKAETIRRLLGGRYAVKACRGHVRDLPERGLGVRIEEGFAPEYEIARGKSRVLAELRRASAGPGTVYLASDPDREGEAIAWHLAEALGLPAARVRRVAIREITARGVAEAFGSPGEIHLPRVHAQQARRVLDRLVGYRLSPLLWKKIGRGLSAGRVQSVALRLVAEREREISAFAPRTTWSVVARLEQRGREFLAESPHLGDAAAAEALARGLRERGEAEVVDVRAGERAEPPPPPFTTSGLQQQAFLELGLSAKRSMAAAQQLYEGVRLGREGSVGLITYPRTDSFRASAGAVAEARAVIARLHGPSALPERPVFRGRRRGAQDAHEAIRPADPGRLPDPLRGPLRADLFRLYRLIWRRFLESQMKPARARIVDVALKSGVATLAARGREVLEQGWRASGGPLRGAPDPLPSLAVGDRVALRGVAVERHVSEPPPRHTEASLVKALERHGIGRPGTYAPTLALLQERGYVDLQERRLAPTELGLLVSDKLVRHFPSLVDTGFTARMEEELDGIEDGAASWTDVLSTFYARFSEDLEKARREMEGEKGREAPGAEACEACGKPMQVRWSRHGRFLGCSGYPVCKGRRSSGEEESLGEPCERCGSRMRARSGPRGRFLGCSRYPRCKGARPLPLKASGIEIPADWKESCDKCGRPLKIRHGRRGGYIACSAYPVCKNTRRFPRAWRTDPA